METNFRCPGRPRQADKLLREPPALPREHSFWDAPLWVEALGSLSAKLGCVHTHSEGGLAHGTPAHCRPPPVLCADTDIWWSAPGASVQGLAVTPDHRLLFMSSECSAQQGRRSDAGMSLLSALGPRRSHPTPTTC